MRTLAAVAFALAVSSGCNDPVHEDRVNALGPETAVPRGPQHRPGQPCLTCHGGGGPASLQMSVGGTVYAVKGQSDPLAGVTVHLVDAHESSVDAETNAAGNFFVPVSTWAPTYPVHVSLSFANQVTPMDAHIGRDGSCAGCHYEPADRSSPGAIYLVSDPVDLPAGGSP